MGAPVKSSALFGRGELKLKVSSGVQGERELQRVIGGKGREEEPAARLKFSAT